MNYIAAWRFKDFLFCQKKSVCLEGFKKNKHLS